MRILPRILVTGTSHSGKNWVSLFLARLFPCVADQEPFHLWSPPGIPIDGEREGFKFVTERSSAAVKSRVAGSFNSFASVPRGFFKTSGGIDSRLHNALVQMRRVRMHRSDTAVIVKDPYALYSAEWLCETLGWRPWLLIRDPVSYVGTLVGEKTVWDVGLHLQDPSLVEHLDRVGDECASRALHCADQGLLMTSIHRWITSAVHFRYLLGRHASSPGWAFSALENLNSCPTASFGHALRSLGIAATDQEIAEAVPTSGCNIPPGLRYIQQDKQTLSPSSGGVLSSADVLLIQSMTSLLYSEIKSRLSC